MQITNVRIVKMCNEQDGLLKAVANVTIDNMIAIHDIRVIQTNGRMFIAMPNKQINDGTYKDIVHPINQAGRDMITEAVISAYQRALEEQPETTSVQ